MKKLLITVRMMDGNSVVEETSALYDLSDSPQAPAPRSTASSGSTVGLVMQMRRLFRRELIKRNLIVGEPEDSARVR